MFKTVVIILLVSILLAVALPPSQTKVLEAPSLPREKIALDGNTTKFVPHPAGDKETIIGIVEKVIEQRNRQDTVYFADGNRTVGCYAEQFDNWKPGKLHKILVYTAANDCGGRHIVGVEVMEK